MPSEGLPHQAEVENALLDLLGHSTRPVTPTEAYRALALKFGLTVEQQNRLLDSEPRPEWENLVRFARRRLVDQGFLDKSLRGRWQLTELGRVAAAL